MTEDADASVVPSGLVERATVRGIDLDRATIPELQQRMDRGDLATADLTAAYLDRISALDPLLHAVLFIDPTALDQAAQSDRRRSEGRCAGPMDGIPVLLKDSVDTAGLGTTAGSRALRDVPPARDAALVRRLRAAGAVILGKTNLSEWSNFRSTESTSGWSGVGGQTRNPHALDRSPGGSSSGSAVGVAAALAQVAVGTETDGSIIVPGGMTGVVGHKPTLGLVSRTGVVPVSVDQDTPGPIARHVVDARIALAAMRGRDSEDPATAAVPASRPGDGEPHGTATLRGARLGVWRIAPLGGAADGVLSDAAALLREQGAEVVDVDLPYQQRISELKTGVLIGEFRRDITAYLDGRAGAPRGLAELIEYNLGDPQERTCFEEQELFRLALAAPSTDSTGHRARRAELSACARRSIDEVMAACGLDAIVAVANPPAWRIDGGDEASDLLAAPTPAAVAGYPSVTVPAGFAGPLPVGLMFMAGRWADARILALAEGFERAADARRPPRLRNAVAF